MKPFGQELWIADGPEVAVAGFRYPTRMAVMRLADGSLFIWSPIALTPALKAEVGALGVVRHVVAPNSLHHLYLPEWRRAYPDARLYAPPGLQKKRGDIAFDDDLGHEPSPGWAGQIDQAVVLGNLITTEVVFFHRTSATVFFTDLIQQIPADLLSGWQAIVARLDLMTGPEPSVPRKFRLAFVQRRLARESLNKILAWPAEKVVMAHGAPVRRDAPAFLRRAFDWLITEPRSG
jgi:hypothetical protein